MDPRINFEMLKDDGSNFVSWKYRMAAVLKSNQLYKYVEHKDKSEIADWKDDKDARALASLSCNISNSLVRKYKKVKEAKELWDGLKKDFEKVSPAVLYGKQRQLMQSKLEEGGDVEKFIDQIGELAEEIEDACSDEKISDRQRCNIVMMGLPDSFTNFVESLQHVEDLKFLDLRARLVDEQKRRQQKKQFAEQDNKDSALLFGGRGGSRGRGGFFRGSFRGGRGGGRGGDSYRFEGKCHACGKEGHKASRCPDRLSTTKCHWCGKDGHRQYSCPEKNSEVRRFVEQRKSEKSGSKPQSILLMGNRDHGMSTSRNKRTVWVTDSGASRHASSDISLFDAETLFYYDSPRKIHIAKKDNYIRAVGQGDVRLLYEGERVTLKDVYLIAAEDECPNIFSIKSADLNGARVVYGGRRVVIEAKSGRQFAGKCTDNFSGLYELEFESDDSTEPHHPTDTVFLTDARGIDKVVLWHCRLGHQGKSIVDAVMERKKEYEIAETERGGDDFCVPCVSAKAKKQPISHSTTHTAKTEEMQKFDLVHMDTIGPMDVASYGGYKYAVIIVDSATSYRWARFAKLKSDIADEVQSYLSEMKTQFEKTVKKIKWDRGTEFNTGVLLGYMKKEGILAAPVPPATPALNGRAERSNGVVLEVARSMMQAAGDVPKAVWAEAIQTAIHTINRTPRSRSSMSPYEMLYGTVPSLKYIRAFGSTAYVREKDDKIKKLNARARKCVLLGYEEIGYRLGELDARGQLTGKITISRDVIFDERSVVRKSDEVTVAAAAAVTQPTSDESDVHPSTVQASEEEDEEVHVDVASEVKEVQLLQPVHEHEAEAEVAAVEDAKDELVEEPQNVVVNTKGPMVARTQGFLFGRTTIKNVGSFMDVKKVRWVDEKEAQDVVASSESEEADSEEFVMTANVSVADGLDEKISFAEASQRSEWREAMRAELESLNERKTWVLVDESDVPGDRKVLPCKWVYKIKKKADGSIDRYKARVVAMGNFQVPGQDYSETHAPVAHPMTKKMFFALAAGHDLRLSQYDVKTAYLYADLKEEIYMRPPAGLSAGEGKVCVLKKSIYGLKQAAHEWNELLTNQVKETGMEQSLQDPCLFQVPAQKEQGPAMLVTHVDDICVAAEDEAGMRVGEVLKQKFEVSHEADPSLYVGIKVEQSPEEIKLSQENFLTECLKRFGWEGMKPISTPEATIALQPREEKEEKVEVHLYQQAVGCLNYLACGTRPDIAHATQAVAKYMKDPGVSHMKAVKRIFRYLAGTKTMGLHYKKGGDNVLVAYADADFAGDMPSRKSTSGIVLMMNGGAILSKSKLQDIVALSTAEAELIALTECAREVMAARYMLDGLGCSQAPTRIYDDNTGAIANANRGDYRGRMRQLDVSHKWVHQWVKEGVLKVEYIPSEEQLADLFTKALGVAQFSKLRKAIGVY